MPKSPRIGPAPDPTGRFTSPIDRGQGEPGVGQHPPGNYSNPTIGYGGPANAPAGATPTTREGGGGYAGPYPASWGQTYSQQTPGTQAAMASRFGGMSPGQITADWDRNIAPRYAPGTAPGDILGGATPGGSGLASLLANRPNAGAGEGGAAAPGPTAARSSPGFKLGNRGAQKRMGGGNPYGALRNAADDGTGQPPAPMPGITSDPGPAGGGLQSLLARARAMSPYGRG